MVRFSFIYTHFTCRNFNATTRFAYPNDSLIYIISVVHSVAVLQEANTFATNNTKNIQHEEAG
jgi:hypothetical protein